VFFDNLQVVHKPGPIVEETHYYPFGLVMNGISSKGLNGTTDNKLKFNGNELQDKEFSNGSGIDLYDFNARTYNQQIGRFIQIDPISNESEQEELTLYHFSGNNPTTFNDPDGKCPWCIVAFVGAAVDAGLQLTEIAFTDKTLSQFSFTSVVVSGFASAAGVGIASKIDKAVKVAKIASEAVKTGIKFGANAAMDATISAANQKLNSGEVSSTKVLIDVISSASVGSITGTFVENVAKNSSTGKVLAKQVNRAERIAANSTRKAKQEAVAKATEKAKNYAAIRGDVAATVSSSVTSEVAKKIMLSSTN
jgi:RHS repeat-associated protein